MPSLSILQSQYELMRGHSGGGIHAFICISKRVDVNRIAYATDNAKRWKISAPLGTNTADILLDKLIRDVQRGNGNVGFIHEIKRHHREGIVRRWKAHRKAMTARREMNAIKTLPTFGMF